ncbi:MAG TPA: hypothetical protein VM600_09480 [Actinomycetota bacterium]|nr:hypothetical protein [Actinomycetota bacterium]
MTPPESAAARRVVESPRRPIPAPQRPQLEVIRGRSVPGRRPPLSVLFVVAITICALFMLVVVNVVLGQAGFTQAEIEQRLAQKRTNVAVLELEVQRLGAPSRIAQRAAELGLVPAESSSVLVAPAEVRGDR